MEALFAGSAVRTLRKMLKKGQRFVLFIGIPSFIENYS